MNSLEHLFNKMLPTVILTVLLTAAGTTTLAWFLVRILTPRITKLLMSLVVSMMFATLIVEFWPHLGFLHWIPHFLSAAFEKHVWGPLRVFLDQYSVHLTAVATVLSVCTFRLLWCWLFHLKKLSPKDVFVATLLKAQKELEHAQEALTRAQANHSRAAVELANYCEIPTS